MKRRLPVISEQVPLTQSPFSSLELVGLPSSEEKLPSLEEPLAKNSTRLILTKEKAHRAGKTVLVVTGFPTQFSEKAIHGLAKEAKIACGCGGTVTNRKIELQGNQPHRVRKFFESKGFRLDGIH